MRLFVALALPEDIQQKIATLRGGIPDAKWIQDENTHITLSFLGNVPDSDLMDVGLALSKIRHPEFDLKIENVGIFGNARRPRILWAGVSAEESLMRLQQKIATALENAGFRTEERRFKPHITLARIHQSPYERVRQYLTDNALFKTETIPIESFTLFSSHLAHSGAIYTEEIVFDLEKQEQPEPLL